VCISTPFSLLPLLAEMNHMVWRNSSHMSAFVLVLSPIFPVPVHPVQTGTEAVSVQTPQTIRYNVSYRVQEESGQGTRWRAAIAILLYPGLTKPSVTGPVWPVRTGSGLVRYETGPNSKLKFEFKKMKNFQKNPKNISRCDESNDVKFSQKIVYLV